MADDVDRDRRDAVVRQRRRGREREALLRVGEAVPDDRDGPAAGRLRAGREPEVEVERVRALHRRNAEGRADRRESPARRSRSRATRSCRTRPCRSNWEHVDSGRQDRVAERRHTGLTVEGDRRGRS